MSDKEDPKFINGYLLGKSEAHSLTEAVRALANKTNEHALVLFALCKKLGTTPAELVALLDANDFLNPEENPKDDNGTVLVS